MALSNKALNEAALEHFIYTPVSSQMISYLAIKASEVIQCESTSRTQSERLPPSPPQTPPHDSQAQPNIPSLERFISSLVRKSNVHVPTLMTSLVYLERLKKRLPPVAKGLRCTVHRIFLAALILSAKFLNDSSPKNKHWAEYTSVRGFEGFGFSRTEVNLMEKQLLFLLDWDLNISEQDLYTHLEPFLTPIRAEIQRQEEHIRVKEAKKRAAKELRKLEEEAARLQYKHTSQYYIPTHQEKLAEQSQVFTDQAMAMPFSDTTPAYVPPTRPNRPQYISQSPPSSSDIPPLFRSGTTDTYSIFSSASSVHSNCSRTSTPASSVGSYPYEEEEPEYSIMADGYMLKSPRRDIVRVHIPTQYTGGKRGMLPYEIEREEQMEVEDQPKKKARIGGGVSNIFSRFLGGQQKNSYV